MKILFVQSNYPSFLEEFDRKLKSREKLKYSDAKKLWASEMFGSADFYIKNLKPLGWDGDEVVVNDWIMQSLWAKEHGKIIPKRENKLIDSLPPRIKNALGVGTRWKEIFFEQVAFHKPDVVYVHNITLFNKHDIDRIKKYAKLLVGQIAYPLPLKSDILKNYDLIISSFPHYVRWFRRMGIKSEYLRWCVEGSIPKTIGQKKRIYDVTYVGGLTPYHSQGNKILENTAREVKIYFWGYGEKFLLPNSPIRKNFHGQAWGREMYEIFAKSKIVINRHINISGKYANNMRMFEATAMGALLITDHKSNMSEFFDVGKEVVTYKNAQDLVRKIKYYLAYDRERRQIAKAGQKRTFKDHTYSTRMKELDLMLRKHLGL